MRYYYVEDENTLHKTKQNGQELDHMIKVSKREAELLHASGVELCSHPDCWGDETQWSITSN